VRPVGDEHSPFINALLFEIFELFKKSLGVDHHARARDDGLVGVENAGGEQDAGVLLARQHNGVARIRPAGKPHDDLASDAKNRRSSLCLRPPLGSIWTTFTVCSFCIFRGKYPVIHVRKDVVAFFEVCQPFGFDGVRGQHLIDVVEM